MTTSDTICAIATPAGKGGVGIVRVSGKMAPEVLRALVPNQSDWESHKLKLSRICDVDGELIDESLAVYMKGPNSYTGEDVVEFQCHGGPIILRRVLDGCLAAGCRIAEPGEFTQRAYLNGRLDLTQAEAVADLVNATSESAHKLALEHLEGNLGGLILELRDLLAECMVLVESAIDFSLEEHVYQIEFDEVLGRLNKVEEKLNGLRARFDQGRRQREGIRVVILGPTNAGKSTLFNALHGTERAIVTDIEGTTRDFLEEEVHLGGTALRLVDTAGLRATEDTVEAIGIQRSRDMSTKADLVLWVVDSSKPLDNETRDGLDSIKTENRPIVVIENKSDLPNALTASDKELLSAFENRVATSLETGEGINTLTALLSDLAAELTTGEGVLISRARHLQYVVEASEAIARAKLSLESEMDHEIVAIDVREALDALGAIVGVVSTDDILHRIFAEFCVGK